MSSSRAVMSVRSKVLRRMHYELHLRWLLCCAMRTPRRLTNPKVRVTLVVPTFSRPHNVARVIAPALRNRMVNRIVVSNANPDVDIRQHVRSRDSRLVLINEPERYGVAVRWLRCMDYPADCYISVDDDVLLTSATVAALMDALIADPSAPAGVKGAIFWHGRERPIARGQVDTLWGVFAFTHAQLEATLQLARTLEIDLERQNNGEDLLLSASGESPAHVIRARYLNLMPGGVAEPISDSAGFREQRLSLFRRLQALLLAKRAVVQLTHSRASR